MMTDWLVAGAWLTGGAGAGWLLSDSRVSKGGIAVLLGASTLLCCAGFGGPNWLDADPEWFTQTLVQLILVAGLAVGLCLRPRRPPTRPLSLCAIGVALVALLCAGEEGADGEKSRRINARERVDNLGWDACPDRPQEPLPLPHHRRRIPRRVLPVTRLRRPPGTHGAAVGAVPDPW